MSGLNIYHCTGMSHVTDVRIYSRLSINNKPAILFLVCTYLLYILVNKISRNFSESMSYVRLIYKEKISGANYKRRN